MSEKLQPLVRQATVGPVTIHYEVVGEGQPVVLLHGLSGSGRWWFYNVPALAEPYRVYNVDLIGFGRSRRQRFALHEAAIQLRQWLKEAGVEAPHLVGHSMGGYIVTDCRLSPNAPPPPLA